MREILFRGKRKYDGKWFEGYYYLSKNGKEAFILFPCTTFPWWDKAVVDPSTVGQYTGLTDKNGKRIFEGDILYSDICKSKVVVFDEESAAFCLYDKSIVSPQYLGRYNTEHFEIIGNIHDSPELLEVNE